MMRTLSYILPAFLGIFIVLQAGFNRSEASRIGFSNAILVNAVVMVIASLVYFYFSKSEASSTGFSWWFLFPGVFGFCIVFGGAFSVSRWGAQHTFILIVTAQLVTSIFWDYWIEKTPFSAAKIIGICFISAGMFLALRPGEK